MSVDEFSNLLSFPLNRPIINKTGITGVFNIYLEFAMDETASPPGGPGGAPGAAPPDPAGQSIFSAIKEQLGLKLESTKGPVEVLIIDHIERPTEN